MRRFLSLGCRVTLLALGLTGWLAAQAMPSGMTFDISAGTATTSLKEFATQAHLQLLFDYKALEKLKTPAVKGQLTPTEALKEMLEGSGFTFHEINDHTIAITRSGASTSSTGTQQESPSGTEAAKEEKTTSSAGFLLAQVAQGQTSSAVSVEPEQKRPAQTSEVPLQEVIVTAQKRAERLLDVPVPVTAVNAEQLVTSEQVRIQDYYSSVPGFEISPSPSAGSEQMLAIRGITTGFGTNPSVGITVDDVPFGSSTNLIGNTLPEIDPSELARIEVLRGPQGTLYGASSMGGLLKFVTADPSTDQLSGHMDLGTSAVHNGAELGYSVRGGLNAPLNDVLAIRVSAFTRQDPGYIDNPVLHIDGVNESHASGGRFSIMWRPSDSVSLKVSALYQEQKSDGSSDVDIEPGLVDLQQVYARGIGGNDTRLQAYSANLSVALGSVNLTAITGYNVIRESDTFDFSPAGLSPTLVGTAVSTNGKTDKFSQEVRLTGSIGTKIDWLVGGFYTHEASPFEQNVYSVERSTGADVAELGLIPFPTIYQEYAGFADLTFIITDRFDVQVGGRESHIRQSSGPATEQGFGAPFTNIAEEQSSANAFTYLLTPRFRVSPDLMLYARLASGYRPGGPNSFNPDPAVPRQYDPDKTQNYELGLKQTVLGGTLSFDASIFYIDWKALQINLLDPVDNLTYTTNGSRAKSDGVELSVTAKPLTGLDLAGWVTFDNAVLTESMPANSTIHGIDGDRLPYSSRWSGYLAADQSFTLTRNANAFVGATVSYVGDRVGTFISSPDRATYGPYAKTDLRAGITFKAWRVSLFANNVADRRGLLGGGVGTYPSFAFRYIQPRTVGLSVSRTF